MINKWLVAGLLFLGIFASASVSSAIQTISPSQAVFNVSAGDIIEVSIKYDASSPRNTTGIGVQLYYDSSKLTFTGVSNIFSKGVAGSVADIDDVVDRDGDSSTDKMIPSAWFDISSNWTGGTNPDDVILYKVSFTTKVGVTSNTKINFTGDASGGNTFSSTPVTVATLVDVIPPPVQAIPTLSEWGIIFLSFSLLLSLVVKFGIRKYKINLDN